PPPFLSRSHPPSGSVLLPTLSLHDALPISVQASTDLLFRIPLGIETTTYREALRVLALEVAPLHSEPSSPSNRAQQRLSRPLSRSEEHTSELQSRFDLVCRLLLEKKKTHRT